MRDVAEASYLLQHLAEPKALVLLMEVLERWLGPALAELSGLLEARLLKHVGALLQHFTEQAHAAAGSDEPKDEKSGKRKGKRRTPDWMELVATVAAGTGTTTAGVYQMPITQFWPLLSEVRQQQNEALLRAGTAAAWPYMKEHDREALRETLKRPEPPAPLFADDATVQADREDFFSAFRGGRL
ncbi:MAG: hypothetical protein RhofKO_25930 [Rhodothermales bacterium]